MGAKKIIVVGAGVAWQSPGPLRNARQLTARRLQARGWGASGIVHGIVRCMQSPCIAHVTHASLVRYTQGPDGARDR